MSALPEDNIRYSIGENGPTHVQYDLAIEQNSAPIDYLYHCHKEMSNERNKQVVEAASEYYPKLVKAFESKWGKIRRIYINNSAACVTTELGFLLHSEANADLETLELLHKNDKLAIEARRLLRGGDLLCCLDMQYELLTHLLGSMDKLYSRVKTVEEHAKLIQYLNNELELVQTQFQDGAQRNAVLEYYTGMIKGLGIIVAVIVFLQLFSVISPLAPVTISFISVSLVAGGVGAIISVMQRMSSGSFQPDIEADPSHNNRIGVFRPIIGGVMGVLVYFLMMSELIPLSIPPESSMRFYYIASIAFSAGFTERWAQGLLPSAKDMINYEGANENTNQ